MKHTLFVSIALLALTCTGFSQYQVSFDYPGDWDCVNHHPLSYCLLCFEGTPIPDGTQIQIWKNGLLFATYPMNSEFVCGEPVGGFFSTAYYDVYPGENIRVIIDYHGYYCHIQYLTAIFTPSSDSTFQLTEASWTCSTAVWQPDSEDYGDLGETFFPPPPSEDCPNTGPEGVPYPTGAHPVGPCHALSGIAWLGAGITAERTPLVPDLDQCDDGVTWLTPLPWDPYTMVQIQVTVTAGPNYQGQPLFLSAWKDGNVNGSFNDILGMYPPYGVPEWFIQDAPVGIGSHIYTFLDPGCPSPWAYAHVFRFRLSSAPMGPDWWMGGHDDLGEVEDYCIGDFFIPVNLTTFEAIASDREVTLKWATASERDNAYFEVQRKTGASDWMTFGNVEGAGNSSTTKSYEYADRSVVNGVTYSYRVLSHDLNGAIHDYNKTAEATPSAPMPTEYALHQNYPNPFNPTTMIRYDMKETGYVTLKVFDLMGQEVAKLVDGENAAGSHSVIWDATGLPSGVYVCRMETQGFAQVSKLLLVK